MRTDAVDFVELPDDGRASEDLWYSNVLCGVIRGALEMIQIQVEAHFVSDVLVSPGPCFYQLGLC